jgi:hypothetical protein
MRPSLLLLAPILIVVALASACVPVRPADPPRNNTEIPQGPGMFTGEAGELVIIRR